MDDPVHVELRIEKAGPLLVTHHFLVMEEGEIADYARNAIARFCQENSELSLLDPDIVLKFAKGIAPGA